jgi:hypothetical protein
VDCGERKQAEKRADKRPIVRVQADNPEGPVLQPAFELSTCCAVPTMTDKLIIQLKLSLRCSVKSAQGSRRETERSCKGVIASGYTPPNGR